MGDLANVLIGLDDALDSCHWKLCPHDDTLEFAWSVFGGVRCGNGLHVALFLFEVMLLVGRGRMRVGLRRKVGWVV